MLADGKILLLGATGVINGTVTRVLTQQGVGPRLRLTSSRTAGVEALKRDFPDAEVVLADPCDLSSLSAAVEGVERISVVNADGLDEDLACSSLVEAVAASDRVRQVLRLLTQPAGLTWSDLGDESRAIGMGFVQSLYAHQLLESSGLPMCYTNVTSFYMSNILWSRQTIRESGRLASHPGQHGSWIHPRDVADVHARILLAPTEDHLGRIHELTGPEVYTSVEVAEVLSKELTMPVTASCEKHIAERVYGDEAATFEKLFALEAQYFTEENSPALLESLIGHPPRTLVQWVSENRTRFLD